MKENEFENVVCKSKPFCSGFYLSALILGIHYCSVKCQLVFLLLLFLWPSLGPMLLYFMFSLCNNNLIDDRALMEEISVPWVHKYCSSANIYHLSRRVCTICCQWFVDPFGQKATLGKRTAAVACITNLNYSSTPFISWHAQSLILSSNIYPKLVESFC